ncbi:hypothetical protein BSKO_03892 [Bryopsis sp. KO-2023]|nr:hypothetical protein BSKO_03892 [Bryopsis sp. KO-2023]
MASALMQSAFLTGQAAVTLKGTRVSAPSNGGRVFAAKAGNWCPGLDTPKWLSEDLVGNYGYDPLGLGKDPATLLRFQEGELMNGRWAMLAVPGMIGAEALGFGNWMDAPTWALNGGTATYFGAEIPLDLKTLAVLEIFMMGGIEAKRWEEKDVQKRMYPGSSFDPMGLSKDPAKFDELKLKEIKNGRLAMFAFVGFVAQYSATGKGPYQNWLDHIADPWNVNFATNGVSLPF